MGVYRWAVGGGGGISGDVGGCRGISWDDHQLSDCSIFEFFEKAFRTYGPTDLRTNVPFTEMLGRIHWSALGLAL